MAASYTYDENGNRDTMTYGNGVTTEYDYNDANFITSLTNTKGSTTISGYEYTYYLDGNQKSKSDDTGRLTNYSYDALGRLTNETLTGANDNNYSKVYGYNTRGNRTSMAVTGADIYTTSYSYDANNRLQRETKTAGGKISYLDYSYDPNGNQLSKVGYSTDDAVGVSENTGIYVGGTGKDEGYTYEFDEYDAFNRLARVDNEKSVAEYSYKPDGMRLSKTVNGEKTTHIWDGANIVMDLRSDNTEDRYIRGVRLISSDIYGYYVFDAHGDVKQLTNLSGVVIKRYDYNAFGVEIGEDPFDANPWRFCGEYWDVETDTLYLRNRSYNPRNGRFSSEDPIRAGLNFYTYCSGNPIGFVDPWGLEQVNAFDYISKWYPNWTGSFGGGSSFTFNYDSKSFTIPYSPGGPGWTRGVYMVDDAIIHSKLGAPGGKTATMHSVVYDSLSQLWDTFIFISRDNPTYVSDVMALIEEVLKIGRKKGIGIGIDYVNNNYRNIGAGGINDTEVVLLAGNLMDGWNIRYVLDDVNDMLIQKYGEIPEDGSWGNAFRHAYWNALLVDKVGAKFAKFLTEAHEFGADYNLTSTNAKHMYMDLHNNAIGRSVAVENRIFMVDRPLSYESQIERNQQLATIIYGFTHKKIELTAFVR